MRVTTPSACPACGAALRPDAPWCTLCYADLRPKPPEPEPDPEPPPEPEALVPAQPAPDPLSAPLDAGPNPLNAPVATTPMAGPTWPCTVCGTANPLDRDACVSCGSGFLAGARNEAPLLDLPVVGDLTRFSRAQRFGLAGGVVLAFVLLTLLVGLLLG